jgi:gamma-carbonic anhydrase
MGEPQDEIELLKTLFPHRYQSPKIDPTAFIAKGSQIFGDVWIGAESSVWFNAVLRGDVNYIRIGDRTNIQDNSVVHVTFKGNPTVIGNDVTIGHAATIHACTIKDFALIGMGCTILDGAEIGEYVLLGAGSLVTQNTKLPAGTKAFGRPAKVVADLTAEERESLKFSPAHYVRLAKTYRMK